MNTEFARRINRRLTMLKDRIDVLPDAKGGLNGRIGQIEFVASGFIEKEDDVDGEHPK